MATLALVADLATLHQAWRRLRENKGGAGGDGVWPEQFAQRLDEELGRLRHEILAGRYRPGPLRRAVIPKADGGQRVLAIPCVRDRVAQGATRIVLQAALEPRQSGLSFAYRPARGVPGAIAAVRHGHAHGLVWTLEADIAQYFDTIPHKRLLAELAIWIEDEGILALIATWMRGFGSAGRGVAQGAPISPMLANLYLHPLDRLLAASGHAPVRYADDFVVLARDARHAAAARAMAREMLADRGLALKPEKTRIIPPGTAFTFLGETLRAPG